MAHVTAGGQTVEFIADHPPTATSHASTVVELDSGDLLASWFGGTHEAAPDVAIWIARRSAHGWLQPQELVREPQIATFNPVLFESARHLLWLYYKYGPGPGFWSAGRLSSHDRGKTWSAPEHLPAGIYGPIRTKPLVLGNGVILSGSSVESYGSWACWIEHSSDDGLTWQRIGPIPAPAKLASSAPKPGVPYGVIQPAIVHLSGTHIRLYARSTPQIGRICQADSFDNGLSWSEVIATSLPNPNSGIDAVHLHNGASVMVYNRSVSERSPLNLAITFDGEHWRDFYQLEGGKGEYSYPAIIEARNGDLLITYTWKRQKIRFVRFPVSMIPGR